MQALGRKWQQKGAADALHEMTSRRCPNLDQSHSLKSPLLRVEVTAGSQVLQHFEAETSSWLLRTCQVVDTTPLSVDFSCCFRHFLRFTNVSR